MKPVKPMIRVCIFYANGKKDENGELNYHKIETIVSGFKRTQEILEGYFESVPGSDITEQKSLVAFCNENGIAEGLKSNDLAQMCLKELGFSVGRIFYDPPLLGNVLLTHSEEKSLTDNQVVMINKVVEQVKSKWNGKSSKEKTKTNTSEKNVPQTTTNTSTKSVVDDESTDSGMGDEKMKDDDDDDDDEDYDGKEDDDGDEFDDDFFDKELEDENEVSKTVEYDSGEDDV